MVSVFTEPKYAGLAARTVALHALDHGLGCITRDTSFVDQIETLSTFPAVVMLRAFRLINKSAPHACACELVAADGHTVQLTGQHGLIFIDRKLTLDFRVAYDLEPWLAPQFAWLVRNGDNALTATGNDVWAVGCFSVIQQTFGKGASVAPIVVFARFRVTAWCLVFAFVGVNTTSFIITELVS